MGQQPNGPGSGCERSIFVGEKSGCSACTYNRSVIPAADANHASARWKATRYALGALWDFGSELFCTITVRADVSAHLARCLASHRSIYLVVCLWENCRPV